MKKTLHRIMKAATVLVLAVIMLALLALGGLNVAKYGIYVRIGQFPARIRHASIRHRQHITHTTSPSARNCRNRLGFVFFADIIKHVAKSCFQIRLRYQ